MKIHISLTLLTLAACLTVLSMVGHKSHGSVAGASIAIIVNKDNPVSQLSASEVKLYWLRKIKKRWPELNKNIKPVDRKSKCAEQDAFYSKVLGMTASDVETYFIQRQYDNAEKPQDKFANDGDIIEFVSSEPGAIGFVNAANANDKVKVVLTID